MSNLTDVANKARVSITTVSRVINDSDKVNSETRNRVLSAMRALGYKPSRVAQRLRGVKGRSKLLGLIIPDIQNPFYSNIVRGIEDVAYQHNYAVILCNSDEDPEKENFYLDVLRSESVDGIILPPIHQNGETIESLIASGIPLVCVDRKLSGRFIDTVVVNNESGAYQVTNYLLGLGHHKIGFISSSSSFSSFVERRKGYENALMEHGIEPDPTRMGFGDQRSIESGKELALRLLNTIDRPSALFVTNNLLLLGALETIHNLGLDIPGDISIAGFDDMPWAKSINPPLTVVAQPGYDMGRKAVELLFQRIADPKRESLSVVLEPKLILRRSCKILK